MRETVAVTSTTKESLALPWLALAVTPGLGPTRGRRLVEQFGGPPLILYVRGNVDVIAQPGIAIVDTRPPTPYGLGMAERLACDLAARGLAIFSGLARGVDAAGRRGAVAVKGKTVAVLGTGVDVIYPKEHTRPDGANA